MSNLAVYIYRKEDKSCSSSHSFVKFDLKFFNLTWTDEEAAPLVGGTIPFDSICKAAAAHDHLFAPITRHMTDPLAITRAPSPVSYSIAIQELPEAQIHAEINRLATSEHHLRLTNAQLSAPEYVDEEWAKDTIKENAEVMERYTWRREIIRYELRKRGLSGEVVARKDQDLHVLPEREEETQVTDGAAGIEL